MKKNTIIGMGIAAALALCAGCASSERSGHTGAIGEDTESGVISGSSSGNALAPFGPANETTPSGANGSISSGNPFGAGPGTGLERTDQ